MFEGFGNLLMRDDDTISIISSISSESSDGYRIEDIGIYTDNAVKPSLRECVVCLVNESTIMLQPCYHVCLCRKCTMEHHKKIKSCPICKQHIQSFRNIFIVDSPILNPMFKKRKRKRGRKRRKIQASN